MVRREEDEEYEHEEVGASGNMRTHGLRRVGIGRVEIGVRSDALIGNCAAALSRLDTLILVIYVDSTKLTQTL